MSIIGAVEALHVSAHFSLGPLGFSMRFFSLIFLGILVALNMFGYKYTSKVGFTLIIFVFISIISMVLGLLSSKKRHE